MKNVAFIFASIIYISSCVFGAGGVLPGLGTELNPYLIEDATDFDTFCADSAYWATGVFTRLDSNIDLDDEPYTTALIGPSSIVPYSGYFDGNDYIIKFFEKF